MADLVLRFHPAQQAIYRSPARFKVVAAGRRFGKTVFAVQNCLLEALAETGRNGQPLGVDAEVAYIAVDREQAKRNAWQLFKEFGRPVIKAVHENNAVVTLVNDVRIRLLGMDNPDAARGMKLRYGVLDEYADMPDSVWREIIRPALMDTQGGALFIGTPKGKNHFYELFCNAQNNPATLVNGKEVFPYADYEAFNFTSRDNPTLASAEADAMVWEYANGSEDLLRQEVEAKFISKGGKVFEAAQFPIDEVEPEDGTYFVCVDLAGFARESNKVAAELKRRDEHAIAIVKVTETGRWWVKEIQHGQWDVRETAYRIVRAAYDNQATVGIEKGALMNACGPYLTEYQAQFGRWLNIVPLTHGNKHKWDRIQWALQGRAQKGTISLNRGPWNDKLIEQAVDFPDRRTHDDLLDALAYVDQICESAYFDIDSLPGQYLPLDAVSGY